MIYKSYILEKNIYTAKDKDIFLIYGENEGLKKNLKDSILKEKKNEKSNISNFLEEEILKKPEILFDSILSKSLFAERKIFVLEKCSEKFLSTLNEILQYADNSFTLILIAGILDKKSKVRNICEKDKDVACIPCYKDNEQTLETIIKKELNAESIKYSNETVGYLISKASGDRNYLNSELEKIKLYCKDQKNISYEQIKKLLYTPEEESAELIINACLNNKINLIKNYLTNQNMNINYILILRMLARKVEKLISLSKLKKELSVDEIVKNAKPPIFWKDVPIVKKQLQNWKADDLKKVMYEINNTEIECKKSYENSVIIFLNFLSNINKTNNYS